MERRGSLENYIDDTIMNMIKTVIIIITLYATCEQHKRWSKITLMTREFDFVSWLLGNEWYLPSFKSWPISASKMLFSLMWFTSINFSRGKCEK